MVIVSLLAGMFLLAIAFGIGILAWLAWDVRRLLKAAQEDNASTREDLEEKIEQCEENTKLALKNASDAINRAVEKINAEALKSAAVRCFEACTRLEKTVSVLQKLILENTDRRPQEQYGPEDYAPEEKEFSGPPSGYGLGTTSRLDAEALAEEAELIVQRP